MVTITVNMARVITITVKMATGITITATITILLIGRIIGRMMAKSGLLPAHLLVTDNWEAARD
jgi:hypothetical protein